MITHIGEEVARCYGCFGISRKIVNVSYQCTRIISYSGWKENGWYETVLQYSI